MGNAFACVTIGANMRRPSKYRSKIQHKFWFDSQDLDNLQWRFDSVWNQVQSRFPSRDKSKDEALKGLLRRKLFSLASINRGVDGDMWEAVLLDSVPMSYTLDECRALNKSV